MKTFIVISLLISLILPIPATAGMVGSPDPVEKNLIENQRLNQEMMKDLNKPVAPVKAEEPSSSWWKWALGIAIVGGAAAAASGHGNGSSNNSGGSTGSGTVTW